LPILAEQGLLHRDPPVVLDVDEVAILLQLPGARAFEVAMGDQLEAGWRRRFGDGEAPAQRVREPTLRVQADHPTSTRARVGRLQLLHVEVDGWPPAREAEWVGEHVEYFLRRRAQTPVRDEDVLRSISPSGWWGRAAPAWAARSSAATA